MKKNYANISTTLVIVESPAKCQKIEHYLGTGYKCVASYGHIRELPSLNNINIGNNFEPTYTLINKKHNIEMLKTHLKQATDVILATDDDREGEAIAWHICDLFKLDIQKTKRIVFHEITETAIKHAISNPRTIDMNMVHAQQARQILDVLVGFKLSPMLWKHIASAKGKEFALSAGRCQTPALKLVYENQNKIDNSTANKAFKISGYFTNMNLPFELNQPKQYNADEEIRQFLSSSINHNHIYSCSNPVKNSKQPPSPFTTSRLQQVASNILHYSPKETMKICQTLYEGGYITYMRTDNNKYSKIFVESVAKFIDNMYGPSYFNNTLMLEPDNETQAHEAIRPTDINMRQIPDIMSVKERKMYALIWTNTTESLMTPATYNSITATIEAPSNMQYKYVAELIDFAGWQIVSNKISTDNKEFQYLQTIRPNSVLPYKKIIATTQLKGNVLHYTEAMLVQLLEEKGIGRPSTFSSIIEKIQERGYVKKMDIAGKTIQCKEYELKNSIVHETDNKREFGAEKHKLVIQPLGLLVFEYLDKHFSPLFDYSYTNLMEKELDIIAKGEQIWFKTCFNCNKELDHLIEQTKNTSKFQHKIDENNTIIIGKYGPVIKCTNDDTKEVKFKTLNQEIDITNIASNDYNLADLVAEDVNNTKSSRLLGEYNGHPLFIKNGKFGLYASWDKNTKSLKELGNISMENIKLDEIIPILEQGTNIIREISKELSIRTGLKGGDYLFFKTSRMKKPQFFDIKSFVGDYKICDIDILKSWITEKYSIKLS